MEIPKPFKQLEDDSPMPWGKHFGTPMEDVPADYLFFLWTERGKERQVKSCPVADYIQRNLETLEEEWPDGVWRK
jgi:hypothetical protein